MKRRRRRRRERGAASVADRSSSPVIISQPGCTHCCFCCYMGEMGWGGGMGSVYCSDCQPRLSRLPFPTVLTEHCKEEYNKLDEDRFCCTEIQIRRLETKSLSRRYITPVDATLPKEKLIGTCSSTNPVSCCPPCRSGDIVSLSLVACTHASISHRKSFQLDERTDDQ